MHPRRRDETISLQNRLRHLTGRCGRKSRGTVSRGRGVFATGRSHSGRSPRISGRTSPHPGLRGRIRRIPKADLRRDPARNRFEQRRYAQPLRRRSPELYRHLLYRCGQRPLELPPHPEEPLCIIRYRRMGDGGCYLSCVETGTCRPRVSCLPYRRRGSCHCDRERAGPRFRTYASAIPGVQRRPAIRSALRRAALLPRAAHAETVAYAPQATAWQGRPVPLCNGIGPSGGERLDRGLQRPFGTLRRLPLLEGLRASHQRPHRGLP